MEPVPGQTASSASQRILFPRQPQGQALAQFDELEALV